MADKLLLTRRQLCLAGTAAALWPSVASCADQAPEKIDDELRRKLLAAVASADSFVDRFDAEVWLLQKSTVLTKFVKNTDYRLKILKEVHRQAKRVEVPPEFVLALIEVESRFDRYAISRVGAQGMMQIMPFWKKAIGRESDNLIDLTTNLQYGCTILKHYLDKEDGHWAHALARYNGSYGKYWYPRKVMDAWQKRWR
ncbi:lytic transglycosylase domain-containing protein [Teredinibacter waterburyi]|jgi:Soluble lytic murein transglycosylase and related regulatory proteins (some contain LysM/invasin domains)|uniref:lytic transglycosylase domain-containing protein n=1 Tax=Teredinibacter waterburyi TaxID=1500538 RepID=UPI00165FA8E7|nr:lytic transglycosylase domain-containing protein [Teredinibacter waterburyi]